MNDRARSWNYYPTAGYFPPNGTPPSVLFLLHHSKDDHFLGYVILCFTVSWFQFYCYRNDNIEVINN